MPTGTEAIDSLRLIEHLARRLARGGHEVTVRETHLSWILLAGRIAIKLKKPVRLPFVDFSRADTRRAACEAELRLNRRLAPALYRRVVDVCGSYDAPRFGRCREPIDSVLCMRRFPDGALMSERLAAGSLQPCHLERLAVRIARLHDAAQIVRDVDDPVRYSMAPVEGVIEQLRPFELARWHAEARRWLDRQRLSLAPVFRSRFAGGAVRDGHGDLHLANAVVLGDDATAFDCIEFDASLRRIDVMADVAFMTMDLEAHGRLDLAHRFLDAYMEARGDFEGLAVLRFHEAARACVRRLVQRSSPGGLAGGDTDYLGVAQRKMQVRTGRPRLAITSGPSGSGKSTIAARLVDATGAVRVRSDIERKRLGGASVSSSVGALGADLYGDAMTEHTYARLARCARQSLTAGYDTIIDAAFLRSSRRDAFARLAAELDVPFTVLAFDAPAAELARRVRARLGEGADPSDADEAVLAWQLRARDPVTADEERHTLQVDTSSPVDVIALASAWQSCTGLDL
ncbi:MAG TPA: AAA family ATPase [Burkholderiaceae bacterium]